MNERIEVFEADPNFQLSELRKNARSIPIIRLQSGLTLSKMGKLFFQFLQVQVLYFQAW